MDSASAAQAATPCYARTPRPLTTLPKVAQPPCLQPDHCDHPGPLTLWKEGAGASRRRSLLSPSPPPLRPQGPDLHPQASPRRPQRARVLTPLSARPSASPACTAVPARCGPGRSGLGPTSSTTPTRARKSCGLRERGQKHRP